MNEFAKPSARTATSAAEGLPRRGFVADDLRRMVEAGILDADERIELIGGEIVLMSPKGRQHEVLRDELMWAWARTSPPYLRISTEAPLLLVDDTQTEPDLIVYPAALVSPDVRGDSVLLVVEVADSSLAYDLGRKAPIYAANGVREYWVINARTLVTTVHRDPGASGFAETFEVAGDAVATPALVPELAIQLDTLRRG